MKLMRVKIRNYAQKYEAKVIVLFILNTIRINYNKGSNKELGN